MNPIAVLSMLAILIGWGFLGYEAVHLGAWIGLALYVMALIAAANPSLWRGVCLTDRLKRPQ